MRKKLGLIGYAAILIIVGFVMTGCSFRGTYIRNGNMANLTLEDGSIGTATVSGNILSGTLDDISFELTRTVPRILTTTDTNPFEGTWTGFTEAGFIRVQINNETDFGLLWFPSFSYLFNDLF